MHLAFRANRLIVPENAMFNPGQSICLQFLAVITQVFLRLVMMPAVKTDHAANGDLFSLDTVFHNTMILKNKYTRRSKGCLKSYNKLKKTILIFKFQRANPLVQKRLQKQEPTDSPVGLTKKEAAQTFEPSS